MPSRRWGGKGRGSKDGLPSRDAVSLDPAGIPLLGRPSCDIVSLPVAGAALLENFSQGNIHEIARRHGFSVGEQVPFDELQLQRTLSVCPICLDSDGVDAIPLTCCGHASSEEAAASVGPARCGVCRAPFHRACAARHALALAERGAVVLVCPVPSCGEAWPDSFLSWALDDVDRRRYDAAVASSQHLRAATSAADDDDRPNADSPRTVEALRRLGVRGCPRCSTLIQKQAEGLLTGCDKMTCRCGCMFCFKCGLEARGDGVSRCRCVGAHHAFIPHSQVMSNYAGSGSFFTADQDLVKRPRGKASNQTVARLRKELKAVASDPLPFVHIFCDESKLQAWKFVIEGPPDTPYKGGWYWGRIDVPKDYPFYPPLIRVMTPNGRLEADSWLCRSVLDYHPEGWQPPWTLAGVLVALLSLMCDDAFTAGAVHPLASIEERRRLARESSAWNRSHSEFVSDFPGLCRGDADDQVVSKPPS